MCVEMSDHIGEVVDALKRDNDRLKDLNGELCAEINEKDRRIYDLEVVIRNMYPAWVGWKQRDATRLEIEDAIRGVVKEVQ